MLVNRVTGRVGVVFGEGVMLMNRVTSLVGLESLDGISIVIFSILVRCIIPFSFHVQYII